MPVVFHGVTSTSHQGLIPASESEDTTSARTSTGGEIKREHIADARLHLQRHKRRRRIYLRKAFESHAENSVRLYLSDALILIRHYTYLKLACL
jgi:hypothetical protein